MLALCDFSQQKKPESRKISLLAAPALGTSVSPRSVTFFLVYRLFQCFFGISNNGYGRFDVSVPLFHLQIMFFLFRIPFADRCLAKMSSVVAAVNRYFLCLRLFLHVSCVYLIPYRSFLPYFFISLSGAFTIHVLVPPVKEGEETVGR